MPGNIKCPNGLYLTVSVKYSDRGRNIQHLSSLASNDGHEIGQVFQYRPGGAAALQLYFWRPSALSPFCGLRLNELEGRGLLETIEQAGGLRFELNIAALI